MSKKTGPNKYPYNEIRECKNCKVLFVRHVSANSQVKCGWTCGITCRKATISKARKSGTHGNCGKTYHVEKPTMEQQATSKRKKKLINIPSPGRFEEELWR